MIYEWRTMAEDISIKAMLCNNYNADFTFKYSISEAIKIYNSLSFNVKQFIMGAPYCKYGLGVVYNS